MSRTQTRICPLCEACCGLEVQTDAGRVVSIRGDAADPFSAGYLCPKGVALRDLHDDPDRLRTPLVRRQGRLEPASWDEAWAEIERRLAPIAREHGRDAVALSVGNPSAHKFGLFLYVPRLARLLGSKNVYTASTLDQMPKQLACGLMYGHWLSVAVPDIERCGHLLVIGANPIASNGSMWTVPDFRAKARALRGRGGRLVVVDPRRSETAAVADEHHPIRPGADVFLLLAMVHTLFDESLVRLRHLEPHVEGLEALRDAVAPYPAERVAERCGLDAACVRRLARELAAAERGCVYGRVGTTTQRYGSVCSWLIDALNVLIGTLDAPGGAMFPKAPAFAANTAGPPGRGRGIVTGRWASRVSGAAEVMGELPMACLAEEIETPGPGQVRALISVASNPVLSAPNGPRLARALETLAFQVSVDIYVNETTRHADVILPAASPFEESHYDVAFAQLAYRNQARYSAPLFAPPPGHVPEWQLLLRLGAIARGDGAGADVLALDDALFDEELRRRGGAEAGPPRRGPERLLDLHLRTGPYGLTLAQLEAAPHGLDLGALEPRLPELLRTASGKIELAPAALLADLARAAADLAAPPPQRLQIVGRRDPRSNNSWMHNLPTLAKGPMRCTLQVHPADAARLGLADGQRAEIRRAERRIEAQVELSDALRPGVVSLPHGWGHDLPGVQLTLAAQRPGANLNALLDEHDRDPLSGTSVLSGVEVEVRALR